MGSLDENRKSFWVHFRISNAPKFFNLVQYLQIGQTFISELVFKQKFGLIFAIYTLLLASWLSWQDLAKFLLHLGNHGSHGKILIKILLR